MTECAKEIFQLDVAIEVISDEQRENDRNNRTCVKMSLTTKKTDAYVVIESTRQRFAITQAIHLNYVMSSVDMAAFFSISHRNGHEPGHSGTWQRAVQSGRL